MGLTLAAAPETVSPDPSDLPVDLVMVIDRSGSMQGEKIAAARHAVRQLLDRLTGRDRLALVAYADGVEVVAPLTPVDADRRNRLIRRVGRIRPGGGTNLGGGLQQAIELLAGTAVDGRQRRVVLISDGLANQGVTDPVALGRMAAAATDHHFAISTVGVGLEFNELLMTAIADNGLGRYYFLENPQVFAQVFEKEFQSARRIAASNVAIRIPLAAGVQLVDAGGFPIHYEAGVAVIRPGNLVAGQERKLFLNFQVPTDKKRDFALGRLRLTYEYLGEFRTLPATGRLKVACVADPGEVLASVDKATWSRQVVQEAYSRLKERVADAVRRGDAREAERCIQAYADHQAQVNAGVGSEAVDKHLRTEVQVLRDSVAETFSGPPAAVAVKQKQTAKALQYESYQQRRCKHE